MNKLFSLVALCVLVFITFSCSSPLVAQRRMQRNSAGKTSADTSAPNNRLANFSGKEIRNIVYSSGKNFKGEEQQLSFDVYKPKDAEGKKFPAIFMIHGGGFSFGDKTNLTAECAKLADNGYVVISINYRLGFGAAMRPNCNDSNALKQAIYRAVQDANAAINFAVKNADDYNIDKDWIFIGGQSAGAITALITAYLQNQDINLLFPDFASNMGKLSADDEATGFKIKGVISMWGAFINPELITAQTALPTIFFQGEMDKAVPFNSRPFVACQTATIIYGTYPLYNRLKSLGVTAIAHVDPQGGHGVFDADFRIKNILCFLNDVRQGIKKQVYLTGTDDSCNK